MSLWEIFRRRKYLLFQLSQLAMSVQTRASWSLDDMKKYYEAIPNPKSRLKEALMR
jgi:hypothetical protein